MNEKQKETSLKRIEELLKNRPIFVGAYPYTEKQITEYLNKLEVAWAEKKTITRFQSFE